MPKSNLEERDYRMDRKGKDLDRTMLELQTYCNLQIKALFKSNLELVEIALGGNKTPGFKTIRSAILRSGNDAIRNVQAEFERIIENVKGGE